MLKHRCRILKMTEESLDGSPVIGWTPVPIDTFSNPSPAEYACFLDLTFIRRGKDPQWTAEAGRPADRSGVFFALADIPLTSGDRIQMVKGPAGTFVAEGAFDEAWTPDGRHHIEVGVVEVAGQIARAQYTQNG